MVGYHDFYVQYLSHFLKTFEMALINYEINLILTWSATSLMSSGAPANQATTFAKVETKLYVLPVTFSTQGNAKLLQQLKSGFKWIINWNKYQLKVTIQRQNQYLDYLIGPSFQGVSIIFVLSFEDNAVRTGHTRYFFPSIEIKEQNNMINTKQMTNQ